MARQAFDLLPTSQDEDAFPASPLDRQNAATSSAFESQFGRLSSDETPAMPSLRKRAITNRIRAEDLGARGIPTYRNASGDVTPVTDETGGALRGLSQKTGIAYDSQGKPKQISYDETGPPKLSDPFDRIPAVTDPKTGAIEKYGPGGIYQYVGQDPEATARVQRAADDKDLSKESSLLGRKLTLDEHDLVQANKAQKELHKNLTGAVPTLGELAPDGTSKYAGADLGTIKKAIDDHFDSEYAAPEANEKAGFFGKTLTPEAQALRASIDARKAKAHDTAAQIFDLNDQMSALHSNVESGREKQRASVETLLAHQEGRSGPLDEQPVDETDGAPGQPSPGGAAALYPPEHDWARMLGGKDAVDEIKGAVRDAKFPAPMAPATVAAIHDANDAQKKAEQLKESDPTTAEKYKNFGASILNGLTQGVGELFRNPMINRGEMAGGNLNPMNWGPHLVEAGERKVFGKAFSDLTKEWLGDKLPQETAKLVDNRLKDTLGAKAGNFIGGIMPYVGAAIATKGTSVATPILASMFYASGYQRTIEDAQARGADPVKAEIAAHTVGIVNGLLALPLRTVGAAAEAIFGDTAPKIIQRSVENAYEHGGPQAVGSLLGKLAEYIKAGGKGAEGVRQEAVDAINRIKVEIGKTAVDRAKTVAATAAGHAVIGAGVQTAENLSKKIYNPDQGTFEGVPEQALGFGVLGGLSEGFKQVANARKAKQALDLINSKKQPPGGAPPIGGPGKPAPTGGAPKAALTEGGTPSEPTTQGGISPKPKPGPTSGAPTPEPSDKGGQTPLVEQTVKPEATQPTPTSAAPAQPVLRTIAQAEKAYLEQGGHADRLEAQQKLADLREKYPGKTDRLEAIRQHFAPAVIESTHEANINEIAQRTGSTPEKVRAELEKAAGVNVEAHKAATSPQNGLPEPSGAQKEAGNYQKGHITVGGLDISIENPAGSKRKPEYAPLQSHYGYIKGTVGADKDHVDIFVKQGTPTDWNGPVFVVNQHNAAGKFDEHKAVIGVNTPEEAKKEYLANYQKGWTGGKSLVGFKNPAAFKQWAESGAKGQPATLTQSERATSAITPDVGKVRKLVQGAMATHQGTLKVLGQASTVRETTGDTTTQIGIGVNITRGGSPEILVDHAKLARETAGFSDRELSRTIQRAISEEVFHIGALKWEGKDPVNRAKIVAWGKEDDEIGRHLSKAYSGWDSLTDRQKGHEKARAVLQKRWTGRLTETARAVMRELVKFFRGIYDKLTAGQREIVDEIESILKGESKKAPEIETKRPPSATKAPESAIKAEKKPVTPQIPTLGNKYVLPSFVTEQYTGKNKAVAARAERRIELAKRLQELIKAEKIPATAQSVVYTLLTPPGKKEPSETALAQAERKIAKYEGEPHATTTGKQQSSEGTELPRVPPRKDVQENAPEIREKDREQATGRGGAIERPEAPEAEQKPSIGQPAVSAKLDAKANKALDEAFEGLFAGKPIRPGSEWVWPEPTTDEDFANMQQPHGVGVEAGLKLGPEDAAAVQAELDRAGAAMVEAAQSRSPRFKALFGKQTYLAGKLEGAKRNGPNYEEYVRRKQAAQFERLRGELEAATGEKYSDEAVQEHIDAAGGFDDMTLSAGIPQQSIPVDKLPKVIAAAQEVIRMGIDTPAKLAAVLEEKFQGKARPFSQAFWDAIGIVRPDLRGTHDWQGIYGAPSKEEEKKTQPADVLRDQVARRLLQKKPLPRKDLTELGKGVAAELNPKQVDEAAELGVVDAARTMARSAEGQVSPVDTYDKMVQLYENQPNLTAKTSTSKVAQAYSTPAPLAYAASRLADITGGKSIYEPTAGNGILLIEADPVTQRVTANELQASRFVALRQTFPGAKPFNAAEWAPGEAEQIDRVIANPPFGTVLDANGNKKTWPIWDSATNQIDFAIAAKALDSMQDDGRAVLIMGGKNIQDPDERAKAYAAEAQNDFWSRLYGKYKVVDHFTIDGDLYSKQGAGWPVDVVVIAGRGKSPIQLPSADAPRIIDSWDGLRNELTRSDAERVEAGRYSAEKDREKLGGVISDLRGIADAGERTGAEGDAQPPTARDVGGRSGESLARSDREPQPLTGRPEIRGSDEPAAERAGDVGADANRNADQQRGPLGQFRVPYKPASQLTSFKFFIPTNMEVPAREALVKLQGRVGAIDDFVRGKLGYPADAPISRYFAAEQMDALALAIDAIDGETAFVLGDQGGIGKGRVAAGMIRYAIKQGKTPIFITKDEKLYAAMIEDLHDIGSDDITPLFTNNEMGFEDYAGKKWNQGKMSPVMEEIANDGKLPSGADVLFTTYSQIQTDVPKGYKPAKKERYSLKAAHTPPPDGPRMLALKKLVPGSIVIADESHLAAGDSIRAWRLAPLLAQASGAYYSSATFAKRPDSMGIYSRTSLSHATSSMGDLVDAMRQGGVPLQQVVSATLASDGLYLRRERDFSHAVFRTHVNIETKDRDVKLADNYTEGLRTILAISNQMKEASRKLNKILRRQGKEMRVEYPPRVETTNFASKLHNLVSQYLFAIKAESAVRRAIEGVTKGFTNVEGVTKPHKVVIAVQNTMEQAILALERSGRPLNFNGMLLLYLDSQRTLKSGRGPSAQTITITDKGSEEFATLSDKQLQDALIIPNPTNPEEAGVNEPALAELFRRIMAGVFKAAEEKLRVLDLANMPLSPIDYIRQQLTKAGIKNAEITGRGEGIDEDGLPYKINPNSHSKAAHLRYLNEFNNGDTQVLVVNASGSTGISAHASEKFKSQEPRGMLIVQPHLDINEFVQTLYRIDRTGQIHQPYYELLQTALSAELRPAAILGRKMSSLNANTTSNAENEISTGNKGVDIFNQYGDEVVYNYLRSDSAFTDMLDMPKIMDGERLGALEDVLANYEQDGQFAAAVSGRVAVLPEEESSVFWDKVQSDYVALINYLTELGENELLADTLDIKAETLESKELTPAVKGVGRPSGFDQPSRLEKIKADIGSKPLPGKEVIEAMEKLGENAFEIVSGWSDRADKWREKELARLSEKVVGWTIEKAGHYEARWREQEEEIRSALGLIGSGLHLKSQKGLEGYGAITAVQFDEEHPLTPSKQIFTIAINTTKKTIRVPASQLPTIARMAVGDFHDLYESTAERSNQRYMVTGNLLAAYLAIRDNAPTAKIVQYTNDKGELRQGILMPNKFTPGALAKKRVVESPSHMRQLLDAGRALQNAGGEVTIVKPRGDYIIRVPSSKIMGGAFWRDSELARLMEGGEFIERGGAMVAKIPPDNLGKVYQRLLDNNTTLFFTEQETETLGAGKPHKAPAAFYKDDVESVARNIGLTVKESFTMLRHLVAPAYDVNMEARDRAMKMLGERNQKAYETDRVLEAAREAFDKMPRPEQIGFIDKMKLGERQATPELQDLADAMRKIDTESWEAAQAAYIALGFKEKEVPLAWLENHYRVLWKKIPGGPDKGEWIGKARRGLRGSMGQHKQHTLDTMSDGLAEGGIPYSYNPVYMFKLAQADLWKLTTTLKAWKWAKDNGFVQFVKGPFPKAPDGMVRLDDSIAKVYFPAESGEGLINAGQYFVEDGFGRLLNNYLSTDHIRAVKLGRGLIWIKNATTAMELSLSPFHAVFETLDAIGSNIGLGLQKLVNRGILGGNAKVAVEGLMDMVKAAGTPITHGLGKKSLGAQIRVAAANPTEFFKTADGKAMLKDYPRAREMIDDLFAGGWKPTELEQDWRTNSIRSFVDAVSDIKAGTSDNYIGAGLRAFPAANEWLMRPLFDYYIPNLKVAQFFKEYAEALEQNERKLKGGVLTRAALARQVWRFVEDRFGEMNYDNLFWNRTFKSAMQLMFRSVTWKLGSVSAFGGAFTGQGREFRDAFKEGRAPELHRNTAWLFGMMLLTATLGTVLMYSLTGKWPDSLTDLVFPQIDPKDKKIRASLPTYFKDLVHLIHAPTSYVTSSMSGWIGRVADLWRNKDYYGVQIHDNDDSIVKQALQVGGYLSQTMLPFSIRGYKNLSTQDVGPLRKAISLMGVQPAPRFIGQTVAERMSGEYWQGQKAEGGIRPGQMETKSEKRRIVAQLEHGDQPNISRALAKGTIKAKDIKPLYQRAQMGALPSQVLHMPLEEAERIYRSANASERVRLAPIMARKRANAATRNRPAFSGF